MLHVLPRKDPVNETRMENRVRRGLLQRPYAVSPTAKQLGAWMGNRSFQEDLRPRVSMAAATPEHWAVS